MVRLTSKRRKLFGIRAWMGLMRECPDCNPIPEYPEPMHPSYQHYTHEPDCDFWLLAQDETDETE